MWLRSLVRHRRIVLQESPLYCPVYPVQIVATSHLYGAPVKDQDSLKEKYPGCLVALDK